MTLINTGATANDGTGDPLRTAFQKINANITRSYFANVGAAIEADTGLTYSAGQVNSVSEGDTIWTQDGYRFSVLASGESEYDRETSGGVKLWAEPDTQNSLNILQFGADTSKSNNAPFIQRAMNRARQATGLLVAPYGDFEITEPLSTPFSNGLTFRGPTTSGGSLGSQPFRIIKTTNTTITATDMSGNPVDVNCVMLMQRPNNDGFLSHITLENIKFRADSTGLVEYGIYATRTSHHRYVGLGFRDFRVAYRAFDCWMHKWDRVSISCGSSSADARNPPGYPGSAGVSSNPGWSDTTYGLQWDNGSGGSGTSVNLHNVWVRDAHVAFYMRGLAYSAMTCCAADHISDMCYFFELSTQMTMTSCAMESVYLGTAAIRALGSACHVTINSFTHDNRLWGNEDVQTAVVYVQEGAKVVFNNPRFRSPGDPAPGTVNSRNIWVRNGGEVVFVGGGFPTGFNDNPQLSGGGTIARYRGGEIVFRDANGTRKVDGT